MNQNSNNTFKNSRTPDDSFFIAVGRAAEEEMLLECDYWEHQAREIHIPEGMEARILALATKQEKRQLHKKRNRSIKRYATAAATVVFIVSAAFTVLFVGADALRGNFFQFVYEDSAAYTKVVSVEASNPDADAGKLLPQDWEGVYYPDYLTEGYEFAQANTVGKAKSIVFQNTEQDVLILTQEPSDGAEILVDKEGADTGETSIQGNPAFWTSKDGETTLMWNQYGLLLMLYGPVGLEEVKKIGEHLLYVN